MTSYCDLCDCFYKNRNSHYKTKKHSESMSIKALYDEINNLKNENKLLNEMNKLLNEIIILKDSK